MICIVLQVRMLHAESYCVLSTADNTVVEEKNMHEKQSVASISKIMTAVVALEHGRLDDQWHVSSEINKAVGSSIYLKEGQSVSLKSLLYGLMLRSGNDAAMEIAKHVSGSQAEFVKLMNEQAKRLGMLNTTFHNPSGLDEEDSGNISTAYDMALLMSYAMKNETFRQITGSEYYTSEWNYRWKNKNKLLFEFPFATGGKTGFTKKAGRTLVSSAENNGVESVVVTLRADDDFKFHEEEHKKSFETIDVVDVLKEGDYQVLGRSFKIDQPIQVTMKKDGSDKLHVKSHFEKDDFVVEVQKNDQSAVYTYATKSTKKGLFS